MSLHERRIAALFGHSGGKGWGRDNSLAIACSEVLNVEIGGYSYIGDVVVVEKKECLLIGVNGCRLHVWCIMSVVERL